VRCWEEGFYSWSGETVFFFGSQPLICGDMKGESKPGVLVAKEYNGCGNLG
jgi:hypothetical protein